jgi:hypothetical protein
LIATCEVNGANPVDYLADVLIRAVAPGLAYRRAAAAQLDATATRAVGLTPAATTNKPGFRQG